MKAILVNIARIIVGLTFLFSGFVKAVDPLGTVYKLQDYAEAIGMAGSFPQWVMLCASLLLALTEFMLGISLLFAMQRKFYTRLTLAFMVIMTIITVWIYFADPVSDCGCFGDALVLTNGQTLLKNIVLTALVIVMALWYDKMPRLISHANRWIVWHYAAIFCIVIAVYSLHFLPLFDFRPYHVGANIPKGMEIPEGAEQPVFETTFIMEKDGEKKEFSLENYPDSTWTFIDSKTEVIKKGYEPPIHDFAIQRISDGEDITDSILTSKGYTFLLISPHLEVADDTNFGEFNEIYDYAKANGYGFFCLTASTDKAISRWTDITGAEYPFCNTDETTLKTIVRSNPGLLLLKNGTVVGKWSHNDLPTYDMIDSGKISDKSAFLPQEDIEGKRVAYIMLWFVLPIVVLVLADRLWRWSTWLRRKEDKQKDNFTNLFKTKKQDNGKENCCRQLENEQEPAGGRGSR